MIYQDLITNNLTQSQHSFALKANLRDQTKESSWSFTAGKVAKLILLLGGIFLASSTAQAARDNTLSFSPVSHFSRHLQMCPPDFIDADLKASKDYLLQWNAELDSQKLDRTLSSYTKMMTILQKEDLAPTHNRLEQIQERLKQTQKHLEKTFHKFKIKANEELNQLNKDWVSIRDRLIRRLVRKDREVIAVDFVKGIEYLDHLSAIHKEYVDTLEFFKLQKRAIPKKVKRIFKQSLRNHLEELAKLATKTSLPPKSSTSLNNSVVKEWLSRAILYRPQDNTFISDPQMITLLHLAGFPPGEFIEDKRTAMTLAATAGNVQATQALLNLGIGPNHQDGIGNPPYYLALWNKHYRVAQVLVEGGALPHASYLANEKINKDVRAIKILVNSHLNPNDFYQHRNALHWAAAFAHSDSVHALLNRGADPNMPDKSLGSTPLCLWIYNSPEKPPKRLSQADLYCKETLAAKLLGHVLEIEETIVIRDRTISTGASDTSLMLVDMHKIFKKFTKEFPNDFTSKEVEKVEKFLKSGYLWENIPTLLENYKKGDPIVFPTRFYFGDGNFQNKQTDHIILIFLYDNKLVIANKGEKSRKPIEMYEIDSSLVTEKFLIEIKDLFQKHETDYSNWLNSISKKFQGKEINIYYPFKSKQSIWNCAWESNETGLYAFIALLRKNKTAVKSFKHWIKYAKFYAIKNFFRKISEPIIQNNPNLLNTILNKIQKTKWPPKLKQALDPYLNKYKNWGHA